MKSEIYTSDNRLNDILDKISNSGISSLSNSDKFFLDSYKNNNQEEIHKIMLNKELEYVFYDDNGLFKFELNKIEYNDDEIHYIGIIYVPDLKISNDKIIEGRLIGKIVECDNGDIYPDFSKIGKYDILDFCNSLEYELDLFLDFVIKKINYEK